MSVTVCPLRESDLPSAVGLVRDSLRPFPGAERFGGNPRSLLTRFRADPAAALCAMQGQEVVGICFAANRGSTTVLGPFAIRPQGWTGPAGRLLIEAALDLSAGWGASLQGVFTFAQSTRHLDFFHKRGFWPRFLSDIMAAPVRARAPERAGLWTRYSQVAESDRGSCLEQCRELTSSVYEGLSLEREIRAVQDQALGDTVLLWEGTRLVGMAVCHWGPTSEADDGACYVKFGAVRDPEAAPRFNRLLDACEAFAAANGAKRLVAGINAGRHGAFSQLLARGFQTLLQGVALHRPNAPGYSQPDAYVLDDWR